MGNEPRKSNRKDRKDAWYVSETDTMHRFLPYLMPNRIANEAVLGLEIDLTPIHAYLKKKNADEPEFRYTFFHVICAALAKTVALRPKLNRFYSGHRYYERKEISLSFVVKKKFSDNGTECLAIVKADRDSETPPIDQIYEQVKKIVYSVRKEQKDDGATDSMATLLKLPRPILRAVMRILRWLEYHGHYPYSLLKVDPYYSSLFITNLGSIRMDADYHHLADWGTNSFFVVIGEKHPAPHFADDGTYTVRETLKLGITVDERIADGYYYAGSLRLLKRILEQPELLDSPLMTAVDTEERKEKA